MIQLFITFFKIGITTFGGGYAMLPILIREIAENKKWATEDELLEYFAIGQATPGIIGVNTATFVGYKRGKVLGAIVATLGFITPSLIIISIIYRFVDILSDKFYYGTKLVKITVSALILHTLYKMFLKEVKSTRSIVYIALALILALFKLPLPLIVFGFSIVSMIEVKYAKTDL